LARRRVQRRCAAAERVATQIELGDALARLPYIDRSAFVLRDVVGLPAAEIAFVHDVGLPAAEQRIRRRARGPSDGDTDEVIPREVGERIRGRLTAR
jgi:DNA-directed RNA polymerase specialized sigma24 family protein